MVGSFVTGYAKDVITAVRARSERPRWRPDTTSRIIVEVGIRGGIRATNTGIVIDLRPLRPDAHHQLVERHGSSGISAQLEAAGSRPERDQMERLMPVAEAG